jgi:chromosomal replication initiator protein
MAEMKGLSPEVQSQWARIRGRLRDEVGDAAYRSWLKSMTLAEITGGRVRIAVPTKFLRDWVATHYANRIRVLWNGENSAIAGIEVVVGSGSGDTRA